MDGPWSNYGSSAGPWSDYAAPATTPAPADGGIIANMIAGPVEAVTGTLGMLADAVNPVPYVKQSIADLHHALSGDLKGKSVGDILTQHNAEDAASHQAGHIINQGLGIVGANPEDVPATTTGSKIARAVSGGAVMGLLAPEAEGLTVGRILSNMAVGAASGAGSLGAQSAVPEPYKNAAGLIGGVAAGVGAGLGIHAPAAAGSLAADAAAPLRAAGSDTAAADQAGSILNARATDPAAAQNAIAPRAPHEVFSDQLATGAPAQTPDGTSMRVVPNAAADGHEVEVTSPAGQVQTLGNPQPLSEEDAIAQATQMAYPTAPPVRPAPQLVAGSEPTTFQQTGDMGIGSLEREQATKNPDLFRQRAADQNAARVTALQDIQSGGDPNALAAGIRSNFDALDQATQSRVDAAMQDAEARAAATGGQLTPEAYGEAARTAVTDAENGARTQERGLWKAVDPNDDLTGNTLATSQAAKDIQSRISPAAKPMAGEEAGSFAAAAELPALAPVQDLIALRSRVSTEMRNELTTNGSSPAYARLTQLRSAIQDNLSQTIGQEVARDDAAVARGTLAADDTTASRIQDWVNEYRTKQSAEAMGTGSSGASEPAAGAAPSGLGGDGTGLPSAGGPTSAPGDQGLPGGVPVGEPPPPEPVVASQNPNGPTFDDAAAARLLAATAATKQRAQTFGRGPIGQVAAKASDSSSFKLPDGRVPSKFFHPGPTGYSDMQALYTAVGEPKAAPIIADYAASSLRRAAMRDDGVLDPAKFERWSAAHQDSLRALPEDVRSRFADAAQATHTLNAVAMARSVAMKDFAAGSIGRVMGLQTAEDISRTVGGILSSKTAVAEMTHLAAAARAAGPGAVQGLRQAVADHIANRLIGNTEIAASGIAGIKADAFQTFVRSNRSALRQVFNDTEIDTMQRLAQDIQRAKRSENAVKLPGQSNTAQDAVALARSGRAGVKTGRSILDTIGGILGFAFHGPIGALAGAVGAHALQAMRETGITKVDDLLTQAMLNPPVAHALMARPGATIPAKSAAHILQRRLRSALIASGAAAASQVSHPQ